MNRLVSVLAAAVCITTFSCGQITANAAAGEFKTGDVNYDGNIDIEDAVRIINHINGVTALSSEEEKAADIDGNTTIDIEDAVSLISYVNGSYLIEKGPDPEKKTIEVKNDGLIYSIPEYFGDPKSSTSGAPIYKYKSTGDTVVCFANVKGPVPDNRNKDTIKQAFNAFLRGYRVQHDDYETTEAEINGKKAVSACVTGTQEGENIIVLLTALEATDADHIHMIMLSINNPPEDSKNYEYDFFGDYNDILESIKFDPDYTE